MWMAVVMSRCPQPPPGSLRQEDGKPGLPSGTVSTNKSLVMITNETVGKQRENSVVILISSCIQEILGLVSSIP